MFVFTVIVDNQPGQLARLADLVAARGANIMLTGLTSAGQGIIAITTDDEAAVREALREGNIEFVERTTLTVRLDDRPGRAAMLAHRLSDRGVNIELLMPTRICQGEVDLAVCVDNLEAARSALGDLVVN